jgi:hypothetical protein
LESSPDKESLRKLFGNPTGEVAQKLPGNASKVTIHYRERLISLVYVSPLQHSRWIYLGQGILWTGNRLTQTKPPSSLLNFDGHGRSIQDSTLTSWEAGQSQWCFSGSSVRNSNGDVIRNFQPFFAIDHLFKQHTSIMTPVTTMFYDSIRRNVGTLYPDHMWSKGIFRNQVIRFKSVCLRKCRLHAKALQVPIL